MWVKSSVKKHEDPSSDPQYPFKSGHRGLADLAEVWGQFPTRTWQLTTITTAILEDRMPSFGSERLCLQTHSLRSREGTQT